MGPARDKGARNLISEAIRRAEHARGDAFRGNEPLGRDLWPGLLGGGGQSSTGLIMTGGVIWLPFGICRIFASRDG